MKKNLFYLFALICSMSLLTACGDSDDEKHVWVGTYNMTDYTADTTIEDGKTETTNTPVSGALYVDWNYGDNNNLPKNLSSFFRYMGGSVLPQLMNAIILDKNGNIRANYIEDGEVIFAVPSALELMKVMSGSYVFPTAEEISSVFPTSGFTTSPKNYAYWSDNNGKFVVKLNIAAILTDAIGESSPEMEGLIAQILTSSDTATIKGLLGALMGADLSGISDATILQLLDWVNNGIPMVYETNEEGHTRIYLNKALFNNLFAAHDKTYDVKILWDALVAGGIVPSEAKAAGTLLTTIGTNWSKTQTFNIGLDLQKK